MSEFWRFLEIAVICVSAIIVVFLILVSLPKSSLRKTILKIYGITAYIVSGVLALYVVSPIDAVPDFIPVVGFSDDIIAIVSAIASVITGYVSFQKSKEKITKIDI